MGRPVQNVMVRAGDLNDQVFPAVLAINGTKGLFKLLPMFSGVYHMKLALAKSKYFTVNPLHTDPVDDPQKEKPEDDQDGAGDHDGKKGDLYPEQKRYPPPDLFRRYPTPLMVSMN